MFYDIEGTFSGGKFVDYLDTEGRKVMYNGSKEDFESKPILPVYYDENKIKRAQQFFEENSMAILTSNIAGLIMLLSDPRATRLLIATNKSSTPLTSYKRYRDTTFHVLAWYRGEFKPGSKLWKSLMTVRKMHNAAVSLGHKQGINGIQQTELSATVFGFMGLALSRPNEFGLGAATDEEMEALVHFWRVIGYMMGVHDNFNICRESLDETKAVCQIMLNRIGRLLFEKHPESVMLQHAALDGFYLVTGTVKSTVFVNFMYSLVTSHENRKISYCRMNFIEKIQLLSLKTILQLCQFKLLRRLINIRVHYTLYLMEMYPEIVEYNIRETELISLI